MKHCALNSFPHFEGKFVKLDICSALGTPSTLFFVRSLALKLSDLTDNYQQKLALMGFRAKVQSNLGGAFTSMVEPDDSFHISTSCSMGFLIVFQIDLVAPFSFFRENDRLINAYAWNAYLRKFLYRGSN